MNLFSMLFNTSLTRAWKTAGALVKPKSITRYLMSQLRIKHCLPFILLPIAYQVVCISWIQFGKHWLYARVQKPDQWAVGDISFKPLKSIQRRRDWSFFFTKEKHGPTGDDEGQVSPADNKWINKMKNKTWIVVSVRGRQCSLFTMAFRRYLVIRWNRRQI